MVSANERISITSRKFSKVLILIILEDGFCSILGWINQQKEVSLNPYYTGRWFLLSQSTSYVELILIGLNPYYTGRWFLLEIKSSYNLNFRKS